MKRQAKRYEKKDKAIYNAKWNPDRDRREDYKNLKKVPKVYALDMNTDEFLEKLLESQELSDLFDRQQVLGTKATFVIEMEIDEFTTVACEFKYFNNLNRYGGQKYQVINGKVNVWSLLGMLLRFSMRLVVSIWRTQQHRRLEYLACIILSLFLLEKRCMSFMRLLCLERMHVCLRTVCYT